MPPYRALVTRSGEDRGKPYFLKNASRLQPGTGKGPQRHCQPKQPRNNPRGCFNAPRSHPPSSTPIPRHSRPSPNVIPSEAEESKPFLHNPHLPKRPPARHPRPTYPSSPTPIGDLRDIHHPHHIAILGERRNLPPPSFVCCKCPTNRPICGAGGRGASTVFGRTGLLPRSRRAGVGHPSRQSDTPNRFRGLGPAFASVEADNGMIRIRSTRW